MYFRNVGTHQSRFLQSFWPIGVVFEEIPDRRLVVINFVQPGSIASQAGMRVGMVLQGVQIPSSGGKYTAINGMKFGDVLNLTRTSIRPFKMTFEGSGPDNLRIVETVQIAADQARSLMAQSMSDAMTDTSDDDTSDDGIRDDAIAVKVVKEQRNQAVDPLAERRKQQAASYRAERRKEDLVRNQSHDLAIMQGNVKRHHGQKQVHAMQLEDGVEVASFGEATGPQRLAAAGEIPESRVGMISHADTDADLHDAPESASATAEAKEENYIEKNTNSHMEDVELFKTSEHKPEDEIDNVILQATDERDEERNETDCPSYRVLHRCAVRRHFDTQSEQTEVLQPGEVIWVYETRKNQFGQTRARFSRGWVSVTNRNGTCLLVATRLTVVFKAAVRENFELSSTQVGVLTPGEEIEVAEAHENASGQIRVRFAGGWTSITARNGTVLLIDSNSFY